MIADILRLEGISTKRKGEVAYGGTLRHAHTMRCKEDRSL